MGRRPLTPEQREAAKARQRKLHAINSKARAAEAIVHRNDPQVLYDAMVRQIVAEPRDPTVITYAIVQPRTDAQARALAQAGVRIRPTIVKD